MSIINWTFQLFAPKRKHPDPDPEPAAVEPAIGRRSELTGQEADLLLTKTSEMADHPAWKAIVAQHAKEIRAVERKILDPKMPDEDANALRRSLGVIVDLAPEKLRERLLSQLQKTIDKSGFRKE